MGSPLSILAILRNHYCNAAVTFTDANTLTVPVWTGVVAAPATPTPTLQVPDTQSTPADEAPH